MQLQLGSVRAERPRLAVIECVCVSWSVCVGVGVGASLNMCVSLCLRVSVCALLSTNIRQINSN